MKKSFLIVLSLIMVISLSISACQPAKKAAVETTPTGKPFKVALVISSVINDASWNAMAYNAIVKLQKKYPIELKYSERVLLPDIDQTYRGYADAGFDLIIGNGFEYGDPAVNMSAQYPKVKWVIVDGTSEADNVQSIQFGNQDTAYLNGYLAASMSKTGAVGGIGGEELPNIVRQMDGFRAGALAANPKANVVITYVGTWVDANAGFEAATAQMNQGVDVIFPVADLTGTGVYQAVKEKGKLIVGADADHCSEAPGMVIGSIWNDVGQALEIVMASIADGTFKGGVQYIGLKEGVVIFKVCPNSGVPAELETKLGKVRQDIIDGKIEVPGGQY